MRVIPVCVKKSRVGDKMGAQDFVAGTGHMYVLGLFAKHTREGWIASAKGSCNDAVHGRAIACDHRHADSDGEARPKKQRPSLNLAARKSIGGNILQGIYSVAGFMARYSWRCLPISTWRKMR